MKPTAVFKFGGMCTIDESSIRKILLLLQRYERQKTVLIFSAIGKTTDKLENVFKLWLSRKSWVHELNEIESEHINLAHHFFDDVHPVIKQIHNSFFELTQLLSKTIPAFDAYSQNRMYAWVVSRGELLASTLMFEILRKRYGPYHIYTRYASMLIVTDDNYRCSKVNESATLKKITKELSEIPARWFVTQGFLGGTLLNDDAHESITTLGREGSDYSAAIFGACLNVASVTLWKAVDGVYRIDPEKEPGAEPFKSLTYNEALALMKAGAKVVHPSAIELLTKRDIPLFVRSFKNLEHPGTRIG